MIKIKNPETWGEELMKKYLRPYRTSDIMYNETVVFIGEEGESNLLFKPEKVFSVTDYRLETKYEEGKDYVIVGNKIKRVKGGAMPFWKVDEYYLDEPNVPSIKVKVNPRKCDFKFTGDKYLVYGEGDMFTSKQIAVTYSHKDKWNGRKSNYQPDKVKNFLDKIARKENVQVTVYGDSVAAGCNASGTVYGGNIPPYMPNAYEIVAKYIEKICGVKVEEVNVATGGWRLIDCLDHYEERLNNRLIDLLILRIGGNDGYTDKETFKSQLGEFFDKFFAEQTDASVVLISPEAPNTQSEWVLKVPYVGEWMEECISESRYGNKIAFVPMGEIVAYIGENGKFNRNWLANNVNHPNDFIIRLYAQEILAALFGDNFADKL